jgi:hypothetical protein
MGISGPSASNPNQETGQLPATQRLHNLIRLLLIATPPIMGVYALWLGQDASWDLRNYHFYNPFAYLNDRVGYDIAVGHVATYYNPLMYLPFYYAVTILPPKMVGFFLGLIPGCNVLLLYAIARRLIEKQAAGSTWFCLAAAMLGLLGAVNLSEIGTSFGDNILSLLVLAAVWLIVSQQRRLALPGAWGPIVAAAAGLLAGTAFGLKQPFAIYAVGLCAAFFGLNLPFGKRFALAFFFGLGVLTGAAATGGFWMVEMWQRFQNPLFPYFNQLFESPWGAPAPYRDERFLPRGLLEWLIFPFHFVIDPMQVGEVHFRDLRFPILYGLLVVLLIKSALFWMSGRSAKAETVAEADLRALRHFILIFMIVAFILWMKMFAVYRYVIVIELLAPLAIFVLWDILGDRKRRQMLLAAASFLLILITLSPGNWGRRPWSSDYFGVTAAMPPVAADSLVLTAGFEPMAYIIPFFPPQVRFLRIQGFLTGPSDTPNNTDRLMQQLIIDHQGPIYVLYRSFDTENTLRTLSAYKLELSGACREMIPNVEPQQEHPFFYCAVNKRIP